MRPLRVYRYLGRRASTETLTLDRPPFPVHHMQLEAVPSAIWRRIGRFLFVALLNHTYPRLTMAMPRITVHWASKQVSLGKGSIHDRYSCKRPLLLLENAIPPQFQVQPWVTYIGKVLQSHFCSEYSVFSALHY